LRTTIVLATAALVSLAYHINSTRLMGIHDSRANTCMYMFAAVLFVMGFVGWLQAQSGSQTRWLIWACVAALLPPGWTTHDLVQQPRRDDQRLPDLTIEQAWEQHRTHTDPPGYLITRAGTDRDRPLFAATWAGRDQEGAVDHPKDRAGCRADMWRDFHENGRHALLDQLTRGPAEEGSE